MGSLLLSPYTRVRTVLYRLDVLYPRRGGVIRIECGLIKGSLYVELQNLRGWLVVYHWDIW